MDSTNVLDVVLKTLAAIGGVGVIVAGLSKWLGNVWRDRLRERERRQTEGELEVLRQQLGVRRAQVDLFAKSQFDLYVGLWKSLQDLRDAGDALWREASLENIERFAIQLRA